MATRRQARSETKRAIQQVLQDPGLKEEIADTIFAFWHTGYIAKAHGGSDEFGNQWPPLADSTVKKKQKQLSEFGGREPGTRFSRNIRNVRMGSMSLDMGPRERQWHDRYNKLVGQLVSGGMSTKDAQDKASSMAWGSVSTAGGVPINIDTTRLESSLDPSGHPEQIRNLSGTRFRLGTNVPYAGDVNAQRRFIPKASEAAVWVKRIAVRLRDRAVSAVKSG